MRRYFKIVDQDKHDRAVARWVKSLRSDRWKQGRAVLHQTHSPNEQFCCLGVACRLGRIRAERSDYNSMLYGASSQDALPPVELAAWFGFEPHDVEENHLSPVNVLLGNQREVTRGWWREGIGAWGSLAPHHSLASLNDNGATFKQIADLIERYGIKMTWESE
jgi:hypothetical protein